MDERYNLHILEALFADYLVSGNVSRVSAKNYRSDVRYYLSWISTQIPEPIPETSTALDEFISLSGRDCIEAFKEFQIAKGLPYRTINRRLSSIRKFYLFCFRRGILNFNPAETVRNVSQGPLNREIQDANSLDVSENLKIQFLDQIQARFGTYRQDNVIESFIEFLGSYNLNNNK
ncbi:MAG: site-specific integrase [Patescibacteria group bacterium]|nr:site-specific integrase [Patescibacteria group bacterium]